MRKIFCTFLLAILTLVLLTADSYARGGRGGMRNMGSVRHASNYRSPRRTPPRNRGHYGNHHPVRHRPIASPARRAETRRVAVGARIRRLPYGYHRYLWHRRYWYFAGGAWYVDGDGDDDDDDDDDSEYVATDPPEGITVDSLPPGTQHVVVDGRTLYVYEGIYYKAIWTDGHATYIVTTVG